MYVAVYIIYIPDKSYISTHSISTYIQAQTHKHDDDMLGKAKLIYSLLSRLFQKCIRAGGHFSFFIMQMYDITARSNVIIIYVTSIKNHGIWLKVSIYS